MSERINQVNTVIFDVDSTLSKGESFELLTVGLGADYSKQLEILENYKNKRVDFQAAIGQMIDLWKSTGNANKGFMEEMFRSWPLENGAMEAVDYIKSKSYRICLMSGAVDTFVKIVAEKLKIKYWYANSKFTFDKNGELNGFEYHPNQSREKLVHLEDFLIKNKIKRENIVAVGDGQSDVELFKKVRGISCSKIPYPELDSIALAHIENLGELKKIL